jgi:hypothetical protein
MMKINHHKQSRVFDLDHLFGLNHGTLKESRMRMLRNKQVAIWLRGNRCTARQTYRQLPATNTDNGNEEARVDCSLSCGGVARRRAGFNVIEPTRVVARSNRRIGGDAGGNNGRLLRRGNDGNVL